MVFRFSGATKGLTLTRTHWWLPSYSFQRRKKGRFHTPVLLRPQNHVLEVDLLHDLVFSFRSNKLEGKKLVYCSFVFRPFLLDCFWEDVVPIIPGTPQFLKVNSVLNRHRGDESHRGPILGPVGQGTISLWNLLSFSQPSLSLGRMCRLACPTCDQANLYNAHRWFGRLPGWLNATPLSGTDNFQALC